MQLNDKNFRVASRPRYRDLNILYSIFCLETIPFRLSFEEIIPSNEHAPHLHSIKKFYHIRYPFQYPIPSHILKGHSHNDGEMIEAHRS